MEKILQRLHFFEKKNFVRVLEKNPEGILEETLKKFLEKEEVKKTCGKLWWYCWRDSHRSVCRTTWRNTCTNIYSNSWIAGEIPIIIFFENFIEEFLRKTQWIRHRIYGRIPQNGGISTENMNRNLLNLEETLEKILYIFFRNSSSIIFQKFLRRFLLCKDLCSDIS